MIVGKVAAFSVDRMGIHAKCTFGSTFPPLLNHFKVASSKGNMAGPESKRPDNPNEPSGGGLERTNRERTIGERTNEYERQDVGGVGGSGDRCMERPRRCRRRRNSSGKIVL